MRTLKFLLPLWTLALLLVACAEAPEGEAAQTSDALDAKESSGEIWAISDGNVSWVGSAPGKQHNGIVKVTDGGIVVEGDQIKGGDFAIDMASIVVQDLDEDSGKSKLEGHLSSGDFFLVEQYPYAKFSIVEVEPVDDREDANYMISGNLTIKDLTKGISFPAMIEMSEGGLSAKTSKFTIDRTEWDIKYNSGVIGTAQDKLIHDKIALEIDIQANREAM